jgi:nucleoside-diphosphate-sugar epimerase
VDTAFVTGGSGFIGRALLRRLATDGWSVRALARSKGSAEAVRSLGAEPVMGDLSDPAVLADGAAGADVTFHLAAHLGQWGPWEEFERGTVIGTANALEGSRRAGVKRFVHCGTEAALMDGSPLVNVDETEPLKPDSPAYYPRSKARAEALALAANGDGGMETVVIRPRFVWGPDDTSLLPNIVGMMNSGKWAWVGGGHVQTSTSHVDNVVEGFLAGAARGRGGEAYFVLDDGNVDFREFLTELVATEGVEAPDRSIPLAVAKPLAAVSETVWRTLRLGGEPPITRFAVWVAAQECTLSDAKARNEIGYAPVIARRDGLAALAGGT